MIRRCLTEMIRNRRIWVVVVLADCSPFIYLNRYLETDESIFFVVERGMAHGKLPYRDFYDHKPPGIYCAARMVMYLSDDLIALRVFLRAIS